MTNATRAPVIVPSIATPKRMSSQLTIQPPGEVMNDESPWPKIVVMAPVERRPEGVDGPRLLEQRDGEGRDRREDEMPIPSEMKNRRSIDFWARREYQGRRLITGLANRNESDGRIGRDGAIPGGPRRKPEPGEPVR